MNGIKKTGHVDPDYRTYVPKTHYIPHYYGDTVRQLMIAAAALMIFTAPFHADDLMIEMPFIVIGGIVLVALAALTSPRSRPVMTMNAVAAGVGIVMYQMWTIGAYRNAQWVAVVLRQAPAVVLLFAFYFSMKTLRAMVMGMVGREPEPREFETPAPSVPPSRDPQAETTERMLELQEQEEERARRGRRSGGPTDALGNPAAAEESGTDTN